MRIQQKHRRPYVYVIDSTLFTDVTLSIIMLALAIMRHADKFIYHNCIGLCNVYRTNHENRQIAIF